MKDDKTASKAPAKKAPKPKKAAFKMPPNPERQYGTTVYTIRTESKEQAAKLISECEFRLLNSGPKGFELYADAAAYNRLKAKS